VSVRLFPRVLWLACVRVLLGRVPVLAFVLLLFDPPPTGENDRRIATYRCQCNQPPHTPPPATQTVPRLSRGADRHARARGELISRECAWRNVHGDRDTGGQ